MGLAKSWIAGDWVLIVVVILFGLAALIELLVYGFFPGGVQWVDASDGSCLKGYCLIDYAPCNGLFRIRRMVRTLDPYNMQ